MGQMVASHKMSRSDAGKGKPSEITSDFYQLMKGLLGETKELRGEYADQLMEALTTGGVGARIPIISKAMEASKRATSKAMTGAEEDMSRKGLSGTPFGEAILGSISREGAYTTSQIGPQYAQQMISGIPGYVGGMVTAAGTGMGTASTGSATTQAAAVGAHGQVASAATSCCFIFIASHGYLHPIVREYRRTKMTLRNRRGYYWLADRLVPLMKKHRYIEKLVALTMVNPMTSYGKYYFGLNKHGFIFAAITSFWLRVYTILGFRKPYKRHGSGEVI